MTATAGAPAAALSRLAPTLIVLALLVATAAAFAIAQRLKLEQIPVTGPRAEPEAFSPGCDCPRPATELSVRLTRPDTIDVAVVDARGREVRTLARGRERPAGRVSFHWDGRDDAGAVVPDGAYRLRVDLREQGRTIDVQRAVAVDTTPPRATMVSARPRTLRLGRGRVLVAYRLSERARPELHVDGRRVVRGKQRRRGHLEWWLRLGDRDAPRGTYELTLVARDEASNVSLPTQPVRITIR